jgi:hypothetical protein
VRELRCNSCGIFLSHSNGEKLGVEKADGRKGELGAWNLEFGWQVVWVMRFMVNESDVAGRQMRSSLAIFVFCG